MAAQIRTFDWSSHPLGPLEHWPVVLRITVDLMLASSFPQCLVWGKHLSLIYNDGYDAILGDKPAPLGKPISEVWAEAWPQISPIVDLAFAGEATFIEDFELLIDRYGRPERTWFTFCYSPVRDEYGQVLGMLDTVVETTGKVLAEMRLRESTATLERQVAERTADRNRLWQLSSDVMLVARLEGMVVAVNPAWAQVLGWSELEIVGTDMLQWVHEEDRPRTAEHLQQLAAGLPVGRFDNRLRHRDGSHRWISWTATPGEGLLSAVGRDVTAEREQADALRQAEEQLRHSQKMEAVGQLTGGLAHDFNNLLQGITGSLQLIERLIERGRHDELPRYIGAARGAARRAATLTHRLLAFSRRQTLDPRATDLNQLVAGMEDLIRRSMGPSIELRHTPATGLWLTRVDVDQLESALLNLCINARDAMPDGGLLAISAGNLVLAGADAAALELPAGEYVMLSVADTGTGMPPEVAARAFDPFFTTKPIGSGTGLGLSMVYGFARQSGGQVRIQSTPGSGTTMELLLPHSHDTQPELQETAPAPDGKPAPLHGGVALLVEDNVEVRMLVAEALRDIGLDVAAVEDGAKALQALQSALHFDLLVTDVGLPGGLNGRQVADAARTHRPELRVLFITGYAESAVLGDGQLDAGMEVLVKPFTLEALQARVRRMLG